MVKKVSKQTKQTSQYDVVIIGGGPAGLMSACTAGESGARVLLTEKNEEMGKKLLLTGGGRCNITNADPDKRNFVSKFGKKGDFLFTPFSVFGVEKTIKFFNNLGVKTKVEEGYRVFPESDNALDVLDALIQKARKVGVEFKLSAEVEGFKKVKDKIIAVILKNGEEIKAKKFILATGGMSHQETGSTGDGFKWLKEIGHKIVKPNPSLVPIKISDEWVSEFSGITLENVGISVFQTEKKVINKKGRVLFTHEGLSGPTILNMSKDIGDLLQYGETIVAIDFFPGVGLDAMHENFKKLFDAHSNKKIKNLILSEVPAKIFLKILDLLKIDGEIEMHSIFREERFALIEKLKKFEMKVSGLLGFDKAIVSSGGLDLSEVDFKTMGSTLYNNLFFAGDILDFDRPSGGYSLQLCWTTGYVAGKSSATDEGLEL
ncbi:MAG: NAD(P)/FAD-dependent oxidoreductase [Minisyncoccia bacterium]